MSSFAAPFIEVADMIVETGGNTLDLCYQCGTCSGVCPWNQVSNFRVREIITLAQLGLEGYEDEDLWTCCTCNKCVDRCPRGVEIVDIVRLIRSIVNETGAIPKTLRGAIASTRSNGNPWEGEADDRYAWAGDERPKAYDADTDYCYFTCCTQAYDPRNKKVAKATMAVLGKAGVDFGVLGEGEKCCGESIRKTGAENVFGRLAKSNTKLFKKNNVVKMLVPSPHCLYAFQKDYEGQGYTPDTQHVVELLAEKLEAGELEMTTAIAATAVYHDPCYLGRHSGIYEAPRKVLAAVPGLDVLEFDRNREDAMCCGGGGGRLWMETELEERFAVLKLREAKKMGADMVVTACPYCISMFEDAKTALGMDDIKIVDITEIVAEALS